MTRFFLLFGFIAGITFIAAATILGSLLPNYDPITQTISEIGERDSPFETTFRVVNLFVAGSFVLFAFGVFRFSDDRRISYIPAILIGIFAVMEVGTFTFPSPHPWHNIFGILSLIGFFAPFALAITWPRVPDLTTFHRVSAIVGALLILSLALNLSELFVRVSYIVEHIGVVQRSLLLFHLWCAYAALVLFQRARKTAEKP